MKAAVGLPLESLAGRNESSLIKYIGVLQGELQMIYEAGLRPRSAVVPSALDDDQSLTLKLNGNEDSHLHRRASTARDE